MKEQFVNLFMSRLDGKVNDDELSVIRKELLIFVNDYDISKKCTDVTLYTGYIPECYKAYIVTKKIEGASQKTLELYNLYLMDFFKTLNKDITLITANDIRVYLYNIQAQRGISNRTLDSRRSAIHAFMEWCCNEKYIERNPCRNIKPIKYERSNRTPLSALELEKVRNACITLRDHAIIEFLYSTGCRVTELERLNISDIDFIKGEVLLFGKGDKHRVSYINARAELTLKEYLSNRTDNNEALFVSERNPHNRLKKSAIEKIVRDIGERSDIKRKLFPHLIRHTTATNCLDRGMDVTKIQKMLGHTNISTTMIYAKVSEQNIKNDHKKCIV